LTVTDAAKALRVSRPALSSLLNGKADLSGEMALRIEKAFGVKMDMLMRKQASHDIARTPGAGGKSACGGFSRLQKFVHSAGGVDRRSSLRQVRAL